MPNICVPFSASKEPHGRLFRLPLGLQKQRSRVSELLGELAASHPETGTNGDRKQEYSHESRDFWYQAEGNT